MPKPPPPQQMGWTFNSDNPTFVRGEPTPKPGRGIITGYQVQSYLHSRTVLCPNCTGLIPLSPNWRLSPDYSIRLLPDTARGLVDFEVVGKGDESPCTVRKAIAICPLCGTTTRKGYIASEAQARIPPRTWKDLRSEFGYPRYLPPWIESWDTPIEGTEGCLGSIQYCNVWRDWYPVYRAGKPPKQGKSPMRFTVPGDVLWHSHCERQRILRGRGISDTYLYTAPETRWIFDENYRPAPDDLVPGIAAMLAASGISDDEWNAAVEAALATSDVESAVSYPPPYREVR